MNYRPFIAVVVLTFLTTVLFTNCQNEGTTTGNPLVTVKLASHVSPLGVSKANISPLFVSGVTFCFKRIRFKTTDDSETFDPESDEDNVDFEIGEVTLNGSEQVLGELELPPGTYDRVELDMDDDCASGKSVQLTNSNGSFSTDDRISIRFEGTFVLHPNDDAVALNIQPIINALNTVTSNSQIRSKAESVDGSFSDDD